MLFVLVPQKALQALTGIAAAVATVLALVQLPNNRQQVANSAEAATSSTTKCDNRLADSRPVDTSPADDSRMLGSLEFSDARYSAELGNDGRVVLGFAGRTTGQPPTGTRLYILGTGDPTSKDRKGRPAPTAYSIFIRSPLAPTQSGCWSLPPRSFGRPGGCGATLRFYFAVVSNYAALKIRADDLQSVGAPREFPRKYFDDLAVFFVQSMDIPTTCE